MQLHVVELPKADRLRTGFAPLDAWVACLRRTPNEDLMNQITYPPVREALWDLESMCSEEELRIRAMLREIGEMDHRAELRAEREEGREERLEDGLEKGRRLALRQILEQQLTLRFGALSPHALAHLQDADAEQLAAWALNLLEASTVGQVFARHQPGAAPS